MIGVEACLLVERRKSRAGVAVLLAIIDAEAPGLGYTEHTDTQQLLPSPGRARRSPGKGLVLLVLGLLLLVGAAVGALLMRGGIDVVEPALAISAPALTNGAPLPPAAPLDQAVPMDKRSVVAAPSTQPTVISKPRLPPAGPACAPTAEWKQRSSADLAELLQRAARHEALLRPVAEADEAISTGIALARTEQDCGAIDARLRQLHGWILAADAAPPPKKQVARVKVMIESAPPCTFDDRFRDYVRGAAAELRSISGGGTKFDKVEDEVGAALVERDCKRVNRGLTELRRIAGVQNDD